MIAKSTDIFTPATVIALFLIVLYFSLANNLTSATEPISSETTTTAYARIDQWTEKRKGSKECVINLKVTSLGRDLAIYTFGGLPKMKISVLNDTGKSCLMTEKGSNLFDRLVFHSVLLQHIRPGEFKEWSFPIEDYFHLDSDNCTVDIRLKLVVWKDGFPGDSVYQVVRLANLPLHVQP